MNREIKFRAYSSNRKEMLYQEDKMSFNIDFKQQKVLISKNQNDYIGGSFDNLPIMQFTGLKDVNGKDIYEDDILEHPNSGRFEIKFEDYGFYLFYNGYKQISHTTEYMEIIGNIHENPELL